MASQLPPSPPSTPTAITGLTDDLLREVFLRLPDLPSLVCAALSCRAFRRAVRSSPAFRPSFRALHAPPLLAFFLEPKMEAVPVVPSACLRSYPLSPLLSIFLEPTMDADFFGVNFSNHGDPEATGWEILDYCDPPSIDGYLNLEKVSGSTELRAAYNPLTRALNLYIHQEPHYVPFEFYTLCSEDGQGPSRVVCVRHEDHAAGCALTESTAVVFSLETMEWQFSCKSTLRLRKPDGFRTAMVVRGLICWRGWMHDQIVMFDSATCQFSLIDLPMQLKTNQDEATYKLGETKDHKFCIVDIIKQETLVSWFMTADDNDEIWIMYKNFSLHPIVKELTGCSMDEEGCHVRVGVLATIDGFVYLSVFYCKGTREFEVFLSLCLDTSEISELFKGPHRYNEHAHPYVMPWPPSLVQSKEDSETDFTGDHVAHDVPVGTREASNVLQSAALQSFSQALMNDSDRNEEIVAELDAFLRPNLDGEGSLIGKITTLDAQLRMARDYVLRIWLEDKGMTKDGARNLLPEGPSEGYRAWRWPYE